MPEKFTKKQRALMDACELDYLNQGTGVYVLTIMGSHAHSLSTARSLERRGWLNIVDNDCGEVWVNFDSSQHADYVERFGICKE
jgi:hypothetical protein